MSVCQDPMAEPCAYCQGTGSVTAEANFLLARLRHARDHRWIGISSDAMVVAAITGKAPVARPHDGWDLGRCLVTRAVAPEHLHEAMDRILAKWIALLEKKKPYWGVDAARDMAAKYSDDVRESIGRMERLR